MALSGSLSPPHWMRTHRSSFLHFCLSFAHQSSTLFDFRMEDVYRKLRATVTDTCELPRKGLPMKKASSQSKYSWYLSVNVSRPSQFLDLSEFLLPDFHSCLPWNQSQQSPGDFLRTQFLPKSAGFLLPAHFLLFQFLIFFPLSIYP